MIEVALILLLFLGVGVFAHTYNIVTRLVMVFVIIGVLVLFYLT